MKKGTEKDNLIALTDTKKNGKERPWKEHKTSSMLLAQSYKRLGYHSKAERVCQCGSQLKFNVCPQGHEKRLAWANFCRVRLCSMCGWRKSLVNAHQVRLVAHEANQRHKLRWLFLTLTVKNPKGSELEPTLKHMSDSFRDRFIKRKEFSKNVVGYFRVLEITRNHKRKDYHPHYHILLAVKPSYFGKDYLKKDDWARLWKECLRVDYEPIVDIRVVKNKRNIEKEKEVLSSKGIGISENGYVELAHNAELPNSAVAEVAKYSVKSSDFIRKNNPKLTDEIVKDLDKALAYKRLLGYGGLLKDIWKELKAEGKVEDVENEKVDLIHSTEKTQCKCSVCSSDMLEELYTWIPSQENYFKKNNPVGRRITQEKI